jgi:hypothetical protein
MMRRLEKELRQVFEEGESQLGEKTELLDRWVMGYIERKGLYQKMR